MRALAHTHKTLPGGIHVINPNIRFLFALAILGVGSSSFADSCEREKKEVESCDKAIWNQNQVIQLMQQRDDTLRSTFEITLNQAEQYRIERDAWYRNPGHVAVITIILTLIVKSQIDKK